MNAIETTAVFEGPEHLHLSQPIKERVSGEVRVILLFEPSDDAPVRQVEMPDFAAMQREVFGDDLESRRLTSDDSEFIRDRGDR